MVDPETHQLRGTHAILLERGLLKAEETMQHSYKRSKDHKEDGRCCQQRLLSLQPDFQEQMAQITFQIPAFYPPTPIAVRDTLALNVRFLAPLQGDIMNLPLSAVASIRHHGGHYAAASYVDSPRQCTRCIAEQDSASAHNFKLS